jgi:hypothetical protein
VSGWWTGRIRQFRRHIAGRVSDAERAELDGWLKPRQVDLFRSMHRADQRHGLDVVAALRSEGHRNPDLLLAGLFHDASKGPSVGIWPRVAWSLGERYGSWIHATAGRLPGFGPAIDRLRHHAERSAEMAVAVGCSAATAELIRHQSAPVDAVAGEALRLADEAN